MYSCQLRVHQWAAFSPERMDPCDWVAWARGQSPDGATDKPCKPDLPEVPAMLRRRLSSMGKAALWCAARVLENSTLDAPVTRIFSSQHGEVSRTVNLLQDLADYSPLSPASFSLSVHNAIGGVHSIAGGVQEPVTALAAGPDTALAALLEAWVQLRFRQLSGGDAGPALVVIYDDSLPPVLEGANDQSGDVQALALLVSCNDTQVKGPRGGRQAADLRIDLADGEAAGTETSTPCMDLLLKFLLGDGGEPMVFRADQRCWELSRGANATRVQGQP